MIKTLLRFITYVAGLFVGTALQKRGLVISKPAEAVDVPVKAAPIVYEGWEKMKRDKPSPMLKPILVDIVGISHNRMLHPDTLAAVAGETLTANALLTAMAHNALEAIQQLSPQEPRPDKLAVTGRIWTANRAIQVGVMFTIIPAADNPDVFRVHICRHEQNRLANLDKAMRCFLN